MKIEVFGNYTNVRGGVGTADTMLHRRKTLVDAISCARILRGSLQDLEFFSFCFFPF